MTSLKFASSNTSFPKLKRNKKRMKQRKQQKNQKHQIQTKSKIKLLYKNQNLKKVNQLLAIKKTLTCVRI